MALPAQQDRTVHVTAIVRGRHQLMLAFDVRLMSGDVGAQAGDGLSQSRLVRQRTETGYQTQLSGFFPLKYGASGVAHRLAYGCCCHACSNSLPPA